MTLPAQALGRAAFAHLRGGAALSKLAGTAALLLAAIATAPARAHSADPMDWLIQHVCVNGSDQLISVDPYGGCPAGTRERRLGLHDPMPYLRHDQPGKNGDHPNGYHRVDSHPILDVHTRTIVAANDFDFDYIAPYGVMHPGDGDGYDLYRVVNGYAGGGGTRDGGGYSQTFFGPDCKPYGGWVFFPVSFLKALRPGAEGRGVFPLRGVYWEQNGEAWPGRCTPGRDFVTDTQTTWKFVPRFPFGGKNGAPTKHIDAIVSTHGFPLRPGPKPHFHLERFFFTDLYGLTRWEAWAPGADGAKAARSCGGSTHMTYEGVAFTLAACRDWSVVQLIDPPRARWPWPYPAANLLRDWHFAQTGMTPWRSPGPISERDRISVSGQLTSKTSSDTRHSQTHVGVRYRQIACHGSPCDPNPAIYQDLPIASIPPDIAYDYGFSGVVAGAQNGTMTVELSELDRNGKKLWSTLFDASVPTNYRGKTASESVYNASSVFLKTSPVPAKSGAVTLRFSLVPRTPAVYDILDTWLMPR